MFSFGRNFASGMKVVGSGMVCEGVAKRKEANVRGS